MQNVAVNGIRKEYTEVLDNRKGESIIKRNWKLDVSLQNMEKETLMEQVNKRKREQEK